MSNQPLRSFTAALSLLAAAGVAAYTPAAAARPVRNTTRTNVNPNVNRARNTNINQNVNVRRDVDVDVDHNYYGGGYHGPAYNPVATAAAVTMTAIAVGTIVNSIPPSCTAVVTNGVTYQHCGDTWYQPRYSGTQVTYVVVSQP